MRPDVLEAFVANATGACDMLLDSTRLELAARMTDYYQEVPGARVRGRTVMPGLYDANALGELQELLRSSPEAGGFPTVTFDELEDSNWGIGPDGEAWRRARRRPPGRGPHRAGTGAHWGAA